MATDATDEIERELADGPMPCDWLKYPPAPACPCELRVPAICATCKRNALLDAIREREAGLRKQHAEDMRVQVALDLKHLARIKAICDGNGSPQDSGDSPEMLSARVIVIKLAQRDEELDLLRDSMRRALEELGVPQPGYPQPVANAVGYLTAALAAAEAEKGT